MKEINIAKVLADKRRRKGITQEELASFIGVSKASVSKWETGQSYPDIVFIPQLASYFNISIDELIDYKPQMTKDDIHKLYRRLSSEFATEPFDDVIIRCHEVIKKYYSCFPLLLQMGILILNHSMLPGDRGKAECLIGEAKDLFIRIRKESDDAKLVGTALYMEALSYIYLGDPNSSLDILEELDADLLPPKLLMASAYQMTGRIKEAKSTLQAGMFENIVVLFNYLPAYLMLWADTPERFEEVLQRALAVAEVFDLKRLHPVILINMFVSAAQGYVASGRPERALDMLQKYTDIVTGNIYPLSLHGDGFFDLLDPWLVKLDLGKDMPRDEKTVKRSMYEMMMNNPAFAALANEPRFLRMAERLKNNF